MKFYKGMKVQNTTTKVVCTLVEKVDNHSWSVTWEYNESVMTHPITEFKLSNELKNGLIKIYDNGIQRMKRRHNL